jgi:hypothetical protein
MSLWNLGNVTTIVVLMRPAPETHAAHLLRPVPTNTPRVPSFEGSAGSIDVI